MRHNPHHFVDDPGVVRRLIRENPWAALVSCPGDQLVASHYPVLLDEDCDGLAVFTHVGRPDDQLHGFGEREIMLVVQGVHGYISSSWYAAGATRAPTWNFTTAHCYGVPQVLDEKTNLRTLARLVQHFERHISEPMLLDPEWAAPVATIPASPMRWNAHSPAAEGSPRKHRNLAWRPDRRVHAFFHVNVGS